MRENDFFKLQQMKKILLIEDNVELLDNTAELLELSNYEVLKAENGIKGVELALEGKPDLIICDIMMPFLDGFGVIHSLQKSGETSDIPFIFLTAKSDRNDLRKAMESGADDFLTKPFESIELLKAVEASIEKKQRRKGFALEFGKASPVCAPSEEAGGKLLQLLDRDSHNYRKKYLLYTEGQRPAQVYYIVKGKVKIYKLYEDGKELITNILGPGDFIGYRGILEDTNYLDNAQVLEDAVLIMIPRQEFLQLVSEHTEIALQFIKLLARSVVEKEENLMNLAYNSLRKRAANGLLLVLDKFKTEQAGSPSIGISRENLAHIIGSATESLMRTLSDFKDEKLIDIRDGKIYLLDEDRLRGLLN
jgi:CRP/FNR family transcriptional regulator, cyclic AMP receptor protein